MFSHPETGSDQPIGSDRESGRDKDDQGEEAADKYMRARRLTIRRRRQRSA